MSTQEPEFPQAAYQALVEKVYGPVFFEKLAHDYNIVAINDAQRASLLEAAGILRNAQQQGVIKSASNDDDVYAEAVDGLKNALNSVPQSHDRLVKQAAAHFSNDPEVQLATLEYGDFLDRLLAAELQRSN